MIGMKSAHTNLAIRSSLALALALTAWLPANAQSSEPSAAAPMSKATMMEQCQAMKEKKQSMKEDMKTQDAQLTAQLAEMNSAPKTKKVDLMAAALTNMVEHRIAMDERKAKMEEAMMQHMMQHMQMGKEAMSECPMMKGMKDMSKSE